MRRILLSGLTLAALLALGGPAGAAPLRSLRQRNLVKVAVPQRGWAYWDRYYLRALGNRSLSVRGPDALRVLRPDAEGRLPDVPMVWYLQWRRSLRPANFDRYHPTLGQWLRRDAIARLPEPPLVPGGPQVPGGVNPPPPTGPPIPEPSTLLAGSVLVAAVALWRRSRGLLGPSV